MCDSFGDVLESGLVNGRACDVVERQRRIHVIDVVQEMEELQIIVSGDSAAALSETAIQYTVSPSYITGCPVGCCSDSPARS